MNRVTERGVLFLFLFFLLLPLLVPSALALGVSPAELTFEPLLPGGFAEEDILISNPKDIPVTVSFSSSREWITFDPPSITLAPRGSGRVIVSLRPPIDTQIRNYGERLSISSLSQGSRFGISLSVPLNFSVTGIDQTACLLGAFSLPDVDVGEPLRAAFTIKNTGNSRISPSGSLTVDGRAYPFTLDRETLPTRESRYELEIPVDLVEGERLATLQVEGCSNAPELTFSVFPVGSLITSGIFSRLDLPATATKGSIVEGRALFSNTGERGVSAFFQGIVERDGQVVTLEESDPLLLAPGEQKELLFSFVVEEEGFYQVRGKVKYGDEQSIERTAIVSVSSPVSGDYSSTLFWLMLLIIIILLILILLKRGRRR
jgi:hypothetical protein